MAEASLSEAGSFGHGVRAGCVELGHGTGASRAQAPVRTWPRGCSRVRWLVPRLPRSLLPDGLFHVATRGVAKMAIYRDDRDRREFLRLLAYTVGTFEWECIAFCLMTTHYHLVLDTSRENLSDGMQVLERRLRAIVQRKVRALGSRLRRPLLVAALTEEELETDLSRRADEPGACRPVRDDAGWRWSACRFERG